jgi:uncharacterized protein (DUF1697 family)
MEMKEIINKKPKGFGDDSENYKYDVVYLIEPLIAKEAIKEFNPKEGKEKVYIGKNVLYIYRLTKELGKGNFAKINKTNIYNDITIRNWKTTNKIVEIMGME